jgi:Protein of unknown function (Hypoth_ymh)
VTEQLTDPQQALLQETYDVFRKTGSWPTYLHLDQYLDQEHGAAIGEVLAGMPAGLVKVYEPLRPDREVALRVAGLLHCEGAEDDLALFLHALKWCVAKERAFRPKVATEWEQLSVTSADAAKEWAQEGIETDDATFLRAHALFDVEWIGINLNGSAGDWHWHISEAIRRFRGVETVDDYLRVRAEMEASRQQAANPAAWQGAPTIVVAPQHRVRVVGGGVEPEDDLALRLETLHPLVRDACSAHFANEQYRHAVLDAAMALRDLVRERSGLSNTDDYDLMGQAFSPKDGACTERKVVLPMPDQEKQTEWAGEASEGTIVIDGEVVRLLRTGAYAALGLAADDLSACTSPASRELDPDVYASPLERLDGARTLLNVLGWRHADPERRVELEVASHRLALTEAARIALDTSDDAEPASRPSHEQIDRLRDLAERLARPN